MTWFQHRLAAAVLNAVLGILLVVTGVWAASSLPASWRRTWVTWMPTRSASAAWVKPRSCGGGESGEVHVDDAQDGCWHHGPGRHWGLSHQGATSYPSR